MKRQVKSVLVKSKDAQAIQQKLEYAGYKILNWTVKYNATILMRYV